MILALWRLRKEDQELEANLGYIMRYGVKKTKNKEEKKCGISLAVVALVQLLHGLKARSLKILGVLTVAK